MTQLRQIVIALLLTVLAIAILFTGLRSKATTINRIDRRSDTGTTPPQPARSHRQTAATAPTPKLEGCISCHGKIEPMHKYGTTETLEQLKDGRMPSASAARRATVVILSPEKPLMPLRRLSAS